MLKEIRTSWFPLLLGLLICILILKDLPYHSSKKESISTTANKEWHAPDINLVPNTPEGEIIKYGRELIVSTSKYFGPKGIIAPITNGMNCQNCHVEAGTRQYGNSFAAVAANYPLFRNRSGRVETIEFRVNDCMQRSLNGKAIDSNSKEMKAMVAYLKWLGKDVPKKTRPEGSGVVDISFLQTAADPVNGKIVFESKCARCHQANGQGVMWPDATGYIYPPLWGEHSYNVSAGLYRLSRLASFIKYNMPFADTFLPPQLTDEEAWNVAAYIASQPRPQKMFSEDWPKIEAKPEDYPFGPYTDGFSELQHKYGPFIPIRNAKEQMKKTK
jgi:thiosulfate dehydrogenase